jgi:hypothetical protein
MGYISTGRRSDPPSAGAPRIVDAGLRCLLADLVAARAAVAADPPPGRGERAGQHARLLSCLESYVAALTARNLPVPPRIRDDLHLYRALGSRR